jgi:hypothetical protein
MAAINRRGAYRFDLWLGFRCRVAGKKFRRGRSRVRAPAGSNGFQMTTTAGRGTGGHGGLDGGDDALDRFQKREREMAGAAMGGGVLRPLVECVNPLQIR